MTRLINSPNAPNFLGRTIDKKYKLLEVLGSGTFGIVYRAVDKKSSNQQEYAVKCVRKGTPGSKERRLTSREWAIHAEVSDHPNIVTLHRVVGFGEFIFFVFELCTGGNLLQHIQSRTFARNDDMIKIAFVQLLDAVEHCHVRGVAHRDIKPENILCSSDGSQLYLCDFGLATKNRITSTTSVGSRLYMAPETIGEDFRLDSFAPRHSDVWALGIVLVNMVTARSPWHVASRIDSLYGQFITNPDVLRANLPISRDLCALLADIFDENPYTRISLQELRIEVLQMDSFFMSDAELPTASLCARQAAATYRPRQSFFRPKAAQPEGPLARRLRNIALDMDSLDDTTSATLEGSASVQIHITGPDEVSAPRAGPRQMPIDFTPRAVQPAPGAATSSTPPSDGPITPETHPVQDAAVIAVPNSISDLDIAPAGQPEDPVGKKVERRTSLFRRGVQALRALSN
ncbi:kinase-like protein [Artomyces pyxidatus]|uniref:Kinase-like protein n=1 Tax=Artomyces pyxidatus TaxID=48021 RepID=A0ACB8TGK9_9AGAM|nr:kinase-like protein [Artomyces pyxidatus]